MAKKIFLLSTICLIFISATTLFAQEKEASIIVIKSLDIEPYRIAFNGFRDALDKQGIKAKYIEYNLEGDGKGVRKNEMAQEINTKSYDLILAIGSGATTFAKDNVRDKPIVFSMVLNPVASGFISNMEAGKDTNITGASMDISIRKQFEIIKSSIRSLKRIVAFYNPKETEQVIPEARRAANSLGLSFETIPISYEKDIMNALSKLVPKQDLLWALADSKVYTPQNAQFIILETLRNGIPFIGISPAYVKAGALISFSCSYKENGQQAAGLVLRILHGENPSNLPVTTPEKIEISINANTAKHIQVQLPEEILKEATNIF